MTGCTARSGNRKEFGLGLAALNFGTATQRIGG